MTKLEFFSEYQRLHRAWPDRFMTDNPTKLRTLFELWEPLPVSELKSLITRMLNENKQDFDLVKAALSLKRAKVQLEKTEALLKAGSGVNHETLNQVLNEMGAENLFDAILKSRSQDGNSV